MLEHVAEDEASLVAMRRLLKPNGKIVLTVPAHQWLWSTHDVGLHHMRRYSRELLRERIEQAGYRIEKLTYTNAALFPVAVLARLADRSARRGRGVRAGDAAGAGQRGDEGDVFGGEPDRAERVAALRRVAARGVRQG